jgi:hypothetical protein
MSQNFQKQLDSILKASPIKTNVGKSLFSAPSFSVPSFGMSSYGTSPMTTFDSLQGASIFSKVFYLLIGIFVVMLLLVAINFLVYPIFPSWIADNVSVPGMDDSKLFWNTPPPLNPVLEADQPFNDISYNYTVMFDVQIDNPTSRSGKSRVFFNRGNAVSTVPATEALYEGPNGTITHIIPNFNLAVYCDPASTDMNITTMTKTNGGTILPAAPTIVKNFPIQTSVRLTIVLLSKSMEIYINGLLYDTNSFAAPVHDIKGSINPPIDPVSTGTTPFGRIQNLRLWRRPLLIKEIKKWGKGDPFTTVTLTDSCVS